MQSGEPNQQDPVRTGRRFLTLDALRGVGALTVMAGHSGIILGGYTPIRFYLAVDMFFVLSGFVISRAYDRKFSAGLSFEDFMKARARRLFPMYFFGLLLGFGSISISNPHLLYSTQIEISFLFGVIGLPSPPMGPWLALFPLNGPFWSLFFEFWVANLAYGLFWKKIHGRQLLSIILISATGIVVGTYLFRSIDLGWRWHNAVGGGARVCFSFFAGVALSRLHLHHPPTTRVPSWLCLLACLMVFIVPIPQPYAQIFEVVVVLAFFPALIYLGAEATECHPRVGKALGDISYAVYATHRPLLAAWSWIVLNAGTSGHALAMQAAFIISVSAIAFAANWVSCLPAGSATASTAG